MPDPTLQTISATESPALFNVSPYVTKWMLFQKFCYGMDIEKEADNRMEWGKLFQAPLLRKAADDLKLEVIPNETDIYVRGAGPYSQLGCTRDATIISPGEGPGALEIKMVFDYATWKREWDNGPPRHIEIQTQQQMAVGADGKPFNWGIIGVFNCGEMTYFRREPVPRLWDALRDESQSFFADVLRKKEPEPFGSPVELPLLSEIYPTVKRMVRNFAEIMGEKELIDWSEKLRMCEWHSKERLGHERAEKKLKAEILGLMQDAAEGLFAHGIKANVNQVERAGYTVKPTTYKTLSLYVPDNLPEGYEIGDLDKNLAG